MGRPTTSSKELMGSKVKGSPAQKTVSLERLRTIVRTYMTSQDYQSAEFWAEKVLYITNAASDAYERARCLYNLKEYRRAAHTIISRDLHSKDLSCLYLASKCYFAERDYREAFKLLESPSVSAMAAALSSMQNGSTAASASESMTRRSAAFATPRQQSTSNNYSSIQLQQLAYDIKDAEKWLGSISLLRGHIYECMDNRQMAERCFRDALYYDIFCYEAFACLTHHQMLTSDEEETLIKSIPFDKHFPGEPDMAKFVKLFYQLQLKKYDRPRKLTIPKDQDYLSENVDVLTALAERHYYNCDYQAALELTNNVLSRDVYHMHCLPVHISCLVELNKPIQLHDIAHKLVDLYPENAVSWFAVGCYYLVINKVEPARRYLSKATTIDNVFGRAWLVFGHSFAIEKEHDQAMAAYFKAYHLMRGCHLPLLYIGVEYGRSTNYGLAEKFLTQAKMVAPNDPFVLHEFGVISYRTGAYTKALSYFYKAEDQLRASMGTSATGGHKHSRAIDRRDANQLQEKWEPLLNNIGYTLRKLERYDEAIAYHKEALILSARNTSTYTILGFLYALKGEWDVAINYAHQALSLTDGDTAAQSLLARATDRLALDRTLWTIND